MTIISTTFEADTTIL